MLLRHWRAPPRKRAISWLKKLQEALRKACWFCTNIAVLNYNPSFLPGSLKYSKYQLEGKEGFAFQTARRGIYFTKLNKYQPVYDSKSQLDIMSCGLYWGCSRLGIQVGTEGSTAKLQKNTGDVWAMGQWDLGTTPQRWRASFFHAPKLMLMVLHCAPVVS